MQNKGLLSLSADFSVGLFRSLKTKGAERKPIIVSPLDQPALCKMDHQEYLVPALNAILIP